MTDDPTGQEAAAAIERLNDYLQKWTPAVAPLAHENEELELAVYASSGLFSHACYHILLAYAKQQPLAAAGIRALMPGLAPLTALVAAVFAAGHDQGQRAALEKLELEKSLGWKT